MKVGFTASCFDLGPHAGHVMMLKEAKEYCDYLIVALQVNPSMERKGKHKPVQSVAERFITVSSNRFVDQVIPYETEEELLQLLQLLRPQIRFLGEDYRGKTFTGSNITDIEIHYCQRKHKVSSSQIRSTIRGNVDAERSYVQAVL